MAVEVFNLNHYVLTATAVDPEFSVSILNQNTYYISAFPVNVLRVGHFTRYGVFGGPTFPKLTIQEAFNYILMDASATSNIGIPKQTLYSVLGGQNSGNRLSSQPAAYIITT